MAAMNVRLDEARDRFVQEQVESGAFPDGESVLLAGLDRLREDIEDWTPPGTPEEEAEKEARFWRLIQEAEDSLARGEGVEVTDIDAYFDDLRKRANAAA